MLRLIWVAYAFCLACCGEPGQQGRTATVVVPDATLVGSTARRAAHAATEPAATVPMRAPQLPPARAPRDLVHAACDAMSTGEEAAAAALLRQLVQDDQCVDCALALSATMEELDERCPWTAAQRGFRLQLSRQSQRRLDAARELTRTLLTGSGKDLGAASAPVVALTIEHSLNDKVESYQLAPAALPTYLRDLGRPLASTVRLRSAAGTALQYESPAGITHSALFLDRVELDAQRRITGIWLIDGD